MLIDEGLAAKAIEEALKRGGDFAEVFVERRRSVSLSLEDGRLERSATGLDAGASVRVIKGRNISFVSTDELNEQSILQAARLAGDGLAGGTATPQVLSLRQNPAPQLIEIPPDSVSTSDKAAMLHAADAAARGVGTEIVQASITYGDDFSDVLVANSEGVLATEQRTRVRIIARAVGSRGSVMQTGYDSVGAHLGMEILSG
ncbi:MAG: PmbA/TldA family metallopeptidase, partial [Thermoleophilia bacterium]